MIWLEAMHPRPGDILLLRGVGFLGWGIREYERICARGKDRAFVHWSHAALVVSARGHLAEVLHNGVGFTWIGKYLSPMPSLGILTN
jgi:hypothetical protein